MGLCVWVWVCGLVCESGCVRVPKEPQQKKPKAPKKIHHNSHRQEVDTGVIGHIEGASILSIPRKRRSLDGRKRKKEKEKEKAERQKNIEALKKEAEELEKRKKKK